ncbi:MAG: hypothetical protein ACOVQ2_05040 [Flavobacterium sp.]
MKKTILTLAFMLVGVCQAQEVYTANNNGKVFLNQEKIDSEKVKALMANNTEALKLYEAGRMKKTFGNILLYGGIATVALKHLSVVNSDKTVTSNGNVSVESSNNILYFVGAGMVVAAIPIKLGFKNKIKKAVELLNQSNQNKTELEQNIIVNANGIGIQWRF